MKKILAFSLIELMITLMAVAVIAGAMAPVITKKIQTSVKIESGTSSNTVTTRCHHIDVDCLLCENSKCIKCNPGQYIDNDKCEPCPKGSFCDGTSEKHIPCPAGQYTDETAQSQCKVCGAGQYSKPDGTGCDNCPTGTYSDKVGASECIKCKDGTYQSGTGATSCNGCGTGKYVKSGECKDCDDGTYSLSANSTKCLPCPAGHSCESKSDAPVKCPAGYYSKGKQKSCQPCQAGYFSSEGATECRVCPTGTYSTGNAAVCTPCPVGQKCPNKEGTNITDCGAGNYSPLGSSECKSCPQGTYSSVAKADICIPCAAGYYCPAGSTSNTGKGPYCQNGYYPEVQSSGEVICQQCKNNTVAAAGAIACVACPEGTTANSTYSECIKCYVENCQTCVTDSATECSVCKPGYKKTTSGKCINKCPEGTAFIEYSGGNFCITTRNLGDHPNYDYNTLANPQTAGVLIEYINNIHNGATGYYPNCWTGRTSDVCSSVNSEYSGCYRSLCTKWSGNLCDDLNSDKLGTGWNYPTEEQLRAAFIYPGTEANPGNAGDFCSSLPSVYSNVSRCSSGCDDPTRKICNHSMTCYGSGRHYITYSYHKDRSEVTDIVRIYNGSFVPFSGWEYDASVTTPRYNNFDQPYYKIQGVDLTQHNEPESYRHAAWDIPYFEAMTRKAQYAASTGDATCGNYGKNGVPALPSDLVNLINGDRYGDDTIKDVCAIGIISNAYCNPNAIWIKGSTPTGWSINGANITTSVQPENRAFSVRCVRPAN